MLTRALAMPALLAASVAVPYVATTSPQWTQGWSMPGGQQSVEAAPLPGESREQTRQRLIAASPQGPGALLYPIDTPLEGLPAFSIDNVLRMDVTKEWVYSRWARKSTTTSNLDLYGVRVPLVTGTAVHDVAGVLTYYFGANGHVHRLSMRGATGDTTHLVALVTRQYGLVRQPTAVAGEQLFQLKRGGDIISQLRTKPAPVLWASTPHQSFTVDLDLQRPDVARPLVQPRPALPKVDMAKIREAQERAEAQARQAAQRQQRKAAASASPQEVQKSAAEAWKPFFPRSRVNKQQVDNLNDRGRIW